MTITISREAEDLLRRRASAEGMSVEAYIEQLVREDNAWGELSEAPISPQNKSFAEVQTAVMEGLAQAKRGESRPAADVFAELRAKHGISR